VNSSYPDGDSAWAGFVDAVDVPAIFFVYAVCAKRDAKWSIQEISFNGPAGQQTHQEVPCPAGTKVVGGGAYGEDADVGGQAINSMYPRKDGADYYWEVNMNNADVTDQGAIAIAICGSAAGYRIRHTHSKPNRSGKVTLLQEGCDPQVTLGGGVQSGSTATSVFVSASSTETGFEWLAKENNQSSQDTTMTVWVMCAGTS